MSSKRTQSREAKKKTPEAVLAIAKQGKEEEQAEGDKRIDEVFWLSPLRTGGTECFLEQLGKAVIFTHNDTLGAPESGDEDEPFLLNIEVMNGQKLEPGLLNFVDPTLAHEEHRVDGTPASLVCVELQPCAGKLSLDFAVEKLSTVEALKEKCPVGADESGDLEEQATDSQAEDEDPHLTHPVLACYDASFVLLPIGMKRLGEGEGSLQLSLALEWLKEEEAEDEEEEEEEKGEPSQKKHKQEDGSPSTANLPDLPSCAPLPTAKQVRENNGALFVNHLFDHPEDGEEYGEFSIDYLHAEEHEYIITDTGMKMDWGHLVRGTRIPWVRLDLGGSTPQRPKSLEKRPRYEIEFAVSSSEAYGGFVQLALDKPKLDKLLPND